MEQPNDILFDRSGGLATIRFNRPDARNSLINPTNIAFQRAVEEVARDPAIRVLLIRGSGPDFCPGADVKAYHNDPSVQAEHQQARPFHYMSSALLHEMPAVTVAAIQGGCAGAGLGFALACDIRVADTGARFNTAFLDVGVAGDMAIPWSLPRLIGAARARDLSFLTGKFDAKEAHRIGLIARLYEPGEFETGIQAVLDRLLNVSPTALRTLKANYVAAETLSLTSYLTLEIERHLALFEGQDRIEAFAAFAEKRAPRFGS